MMIFLGLLAAIVISGLFVLGDHIQWRQETQEDAEIAEQIKHLSTEQQAEIWMAVIRERAGRS